MPSDQSIDPKSACKHKFIINGSIIQFKEYDGQYYQLLGSVPISSKRVNEFTIEKTEIGAIILGIISK